jgi:hypothetical protein
VLSTDPDNPPLYRHTVVHSTVQDASVSQATSATTGITEIIGQIVGDWVETRTVCLHITVF